MEAKTKQKQHIVAKIIMIAMFRSLIAFSIFSAATAMQTCKQARDASSLVCATDDGTATSQTVSFDPRSRSDPQKKHPTLTKLSF